MGFIEMALDEAKEKEVLPEGEYPLVIEDAEAKDNNISVRLSIEGYPQAKSVFHNISLPKAGDDAEKRNNKLLFAKAFLKLFNIPFEGGGFHLEDLMGCRGVAPLVQDEYEGNLKNQIKLRI